MQIKRSNINLIESISSHKSQILKSCKKTGRIDLAIWGNQIRVLQPGESPKHYEKQLGFSADELLFTAFLNKIVLHNFDPEPETI